MKQLGLICCMICVLFWNCTTPDSSNSKPDVSTKELSYQIAFYNVENLFDTINNPDTRDDEFTPSGKKEWNYSKYQKKLNNLNRVLASVDSVNPLVVIGLAEVENKQVLIDLVDQGFLAERGFQIIHQQSPDFRGIDVALLVDTNYFKPSQNTWYEVDLLDSGRTTREILEVSGDLLGNKTSIYVNHWPSRWGGTEKTAPKRALAASVLKKQVESKLVSSSNEQIIILGDLNDYPTDSSVSKVLGAGNSAESDLFNATWRIHDIDSLGTHVYKNEWGTLDHVIYNKVIANQVDTVYAHKRSFMCYQSNSGQWFPSRSFSGSKYYGGYSDHLPIVLTLKTQIDE